MNISCDEDSGFDVFCRFGYDGEVILTMRINKDDVPDVTISYSMSKDDLVFLRDYLSDFIGS
jgi:hypothetical protein